MKIEDMLLFIPRKMYSFVAKMGRFELNDALKEEITQQGLYHFTASEETADQIIKTEYLKPSNFRVSYGKPCAFMYCGIPDMDNYAKNVSVLDLSKNPYINPTMVANAIKFSPKKEDLKNYEIRALVDNAVMCEGHCILPHQQVKKVKMVWDLVRDENGNAVRDENGECSVKFREATPEDKISLDGKTYEAREDYLEFMRKKAQEFGYNPDAPKSRRFQNMAANILDKGRMDFAILRATIEKNRKNGFFKKRTKTKSANKIPLNVEEALQSFSLKRKNPYYDEKFATFVAKAQTEEMTQLDLSDVLPEFTKSKAGEFFFWKYCDLTGVITKKGIHGKDHSERVGLMAMMIAEKEGVFANDSNDRIKDILATAAMYHDLGRVLDVGPHAKNSVRKLKMMNLRHLNGKPYTLDDKKLVFALVDAHEGSPDKIKEMFELYGITSEKDKSLALKLSSIVRDADALDRVRTDINFGTYKTDLKPKYLVNKTSKQFMILSYQLEHVKKHIKYMGPILGYKTDYEMRINRNTKLDGLKQYVVDPATLQVPQLYIRQDGTFTSRNDREIID